MLKTFQMLCQEPWCFHPDQIATLTDWQIEHLYARPAIERAKAIEAKQKGESLDGESFDGDEITGTFADGTQRKRRRHDADSNNPPGQAPDPNSPEFRGWVIAQFRKMGMSQAAAEKQFDEQANKG